MRLPALIFMFWTGLIMGVLADTGFDRLRLPDQMMADSTDTLNAQIDTTNIPKQNPLAQKQISDSKRIDSRPGIDTSGSAYSPERKIRKPWPTGALLLSATIPGGGQVYNRSYIKALLYGGTEIYLIKYVSWRWKQMDEHLQNVRNTEDATIKAQQFSLYEDKRDSRNLHIWLTALVVFVSMFDAYVDAHLADFDQTDKAFDVYVVPEDDLIRLGMVYSF